MRGKEPSYIFKIYGIRIKPRGLKHVDTTCKYCGNNRDSFAIIVPLGVVGGVIDFCNKTKRNKQYKQKNKIKKEKHAKKNEN